MPKYGFDVESAEQMLAEGLELRVQSYAAELMDRRRPDASLDLLSSTLAKSAFMHRLFNVASAFYPYDTVLGFDDTREDKPQAFTRGGSFMYFTLKSWNSEAASELDRYAYSLPGLEIESASDLHDTGAQFVSLGELALTTFDPGVLNDLESLEERIVPMVDAQPLFRSGVGWTFHEMLIARQAADGVAGEIAIKNALINPDDINWDVLLT